MDGVLPVRAGRLVASIDKDAYHPDVVGKHVCLETADPALTRDGGQVLEEHRAPPATLLGVVDHERHLGYVSAWNPVIATDGHQVSPEHCDERNPLVVVDLGEVLDLRRTQGRMGCEEAIADRLSGQSVMEGDEAFGILWLDRAQVPGAAIGHDHVCLPLRG